MVGAEVLNCIFRRGMRVADMLLSFSDTDPTPVAQINNSESGRPVLLDSWSSVFRPRLCQPVTSRQNRGHESCDSVSPGSRMSKRVPPSHPAFGTMKRYRTRCLHRRSSHQVIEDMAHSEKLWIFTAS